MSIESSDRDGYPIREAGAFGPIFSEPADGAVNRVRLWPKARAQFTQFRGELGKKLCVWIATPIVIVHRLVAGSADPDGQFIRGFRSSQHRGHPIGAFDPHVGSVKNFRAAAQAMQNFAEKPFAGVSAAAFREVLGPELASQFGNLGCFGNAGMVFPQPGHRSRILGEPAVKRQRAPLAIDRQGSAPGGIDADPNDVIGPEAAHGALRSSQGFSDGEFSAGNVIGGMLAATVIAVCLIPVTFYVVEKIANRGKSASALLAEGTVGIAPAGK